jgi:RimJ/RimL family protein N-acetyltransferase
MPAHPLLESDRLLLRPISDADADDLHVVFSDPDVMRYLDFPRCPDIETTRRRIEIWMIPMPEWHATWTVRLKGTGAVVGMVTYHHREMWNRRAEIGFIGAKPYWGRGLMSEALHALIAYCVEVLCIHRLEATVSPENPAAIRLVERMGFRREGGPLRDRILVGTTFRDLALYGLLDHEWLAVSREPRDRAHAAAPCAFADPLATSGS